MVHYLLHVSCLCCLVLFLTQGACGLSRYYLISFFSFRLYVLVTSRYVSVVRVPILNCWSHTLLQGKPLFMWKFLNVYVYYCESGMKQHIVYGAYGLDSFFSHCKIVGKLHTVVLVCNFCTAVNYFKRPTASRGYIVYIFCNLLKFLMQHVLWRAAVKLW